MSTRIAMIGVGEAGSAIAADLVAAGASVRGWDPVAPVPDGVEAASDAAGAAAGTEIVLSANSAAVALEVVESAAAGLGGGQVFADLNTAAPALVHRDRRLIEVANQLLARAGSSQMPHEPVADVRLLGRE